MDASRGWWGWAAIAALAGAGTAAADRFTLVVQTRTGTVNNAGTDDPVYVALHYKEAVETPHNDPAKPAVRRMVAKRVQAPLNHRGNDRRTGAVETYRVEFDLPLKGITGIEVGMAAGDDAWLLAGLAYHVEFDGKASRPASVAVGAWISAAGNDGGKRSRARRFLLFNAAPPTFPKTK